MALVSAGSDDSGMEPYSILVAEDDPELCELIRERLVRGGHNPICVKDGAEAIEVARRTSIDVVVTDVLMPRKDGHEVINFLRNGNSGARIVAITGEGGEFEREINLTIAQTLGAHSVLLKPFRMDELLAAVEAALADRRPRGTVKFG